MPIRMTGLTSGLNTESIIGALMSAQKMKKTKVENKKQKLEWKQEKWSALNKKIYDFYKGSLSKMRSTTSYSTKKASASDNTKIAATATSQASAGTYSIKVNSLAKAQYVTSAKVAQAVQSDGTLKNATSSTKLSDLNSSSFTIGDTVTFKAGTGDKAKEITYTVTADSTIGDFVSKAKEAGLNATFDEAQQRFFISAKESGKDSVFEIIAKDSTGAVDSNALSSLGLGNVEKVGDTVPSQNVADKGQTKMLVVEASDSEIEYNGVTLTSSTTNMEVAGLRLNLLGTTGGDTVNITVSNDADTAYDTIKEFITEYNALLKEMNTNYDAASARNYDVLSDDEKEAMTDDEVEKWEGKIKDSLLRRDSTLSAIISSFRQNMSYSTDSASGKQYSLISLGISTSKIDYKEGGLLHIVGDEDDTEFADSENTLKKLLEEDPDKVMESLTNLASNLYKDLNKKMASTKMSSALTFYNDKEMASQLSDYKKDISNWESKLNDMEDKYYKQFSAMETALAKIQSQQNSLASYLGM